MVSKTELKEQIEELKQEVKGLRQDIATLQTMIMFITPEKKNNSPMIIPVCPGTPSPYQPVYPTITYCNSSGNTTTNPKKLDLEVCSSTNELVTTIS